MLQAVWRLFRNEKVVYRLLLGSKTGAKQVLGS